MKIKKGDQVKVIAGKDRGVVGEVLAVLPKANKVVVEGCKIAKKHQKPNNANPDGGIVNKAMPIHVSNVELAETKKAKKAVKKDTAKKAPAKKATTKKKAVKGDKE